MDEQALMPSGSHITRFKSLIANFSAQLKFESLREVVNAIIHYCDNSSDSSGVKLERIVSHLCAIRHYIKVKEGRSLYLRSHYVTELDDFIASAQATIEKNQSHSKTELMSPPKSSIVARKDDFVREAKLAHEQISLDDNPLFHSLLRSIWLYGIANGFRSKSIFISYAWPMGEQHHEAWTKYFVEKLAFHFVSAGCQVYLDDIQGGAGFPLDVFMEKLKKCDHVFLISSRTMQEKLKRAESGVNQEKLKIIEYLETKDSNFCERMVIPILLNYSNYCDPLFASLAEMPMCVDGYLGSLMKLFPRLFGDSKEKFEKWFDQQIKKEQISVFEGVPRLARKHVRRERLLLDIELKLRTLQERKKDHNSQGFLVINGEKGVGKTELAAAYCYSAEAKQRYEKIYWVENGTGTLPELPSGSLLVLNDLENCQSRLAEFNFVGDIDILITTRENLFGFRHVAVSVFTPEEARQFVDLALWNKETQSMEHVDALIEQSRLNPHNLFEMVDYLNRNKLNIPHYLRLQGRAGFDDAIDKIELIEPEIKDTRTYEDKQDDDEDKTSETYPQNLVVFRPSEKMRPWRLPTRNLNFRGRKKLLTQLKSQLTFQALDNLKPVAITACDGMGGVGKTQLAIEFAHAQNDYYRFIIWIPSETSERIQAAFVELARQLNIAPDKSPPEETVLIVKHYLTKHPGNLLIFDDAPHYAAVETFVPKTGCAVLITSRAQDGKWPQLPLTVPVFSQKEARRYVKDMLGEIVAVQEVDIDELCDKMGFLPLALAQAVAYIWVQKISIREFLERFAQVPGELLRSTAMPILDKHLPVYKTFKLALAVIIQSSPLAIRLLNIFSFFNPEIIPSLLLKSDNAEACVEEALGFLSAYSLITIDAHYRFGMHPLVREIIQLRLQPDERESCFRSALTTCVRVFPYGVCRDTSKEITCKLVTLPHLEALMTKAKTDEDLSQLLTLIQNAYDVLGDDKKRRALLEQLLVINRRCYGNMHSAVAETLMNLGVTLWYLDLKKSCLLLEEALVVATHVHGAVPSELVARVLINLGNAKRFSGDRKTGRDLIEKALVMNKKLYPPTHPMIAINLANLANAWDNLGEHSKALQLITEALEIDIAYYGPRHIKTAAARMILANIHGNVGDVSLKQQCLEEVLDVYKGRYGEEHPRVAATLQDLANIKISFGKDKEAHKLFKHIVVVYEKFYGPDHPRLVPVLGNLAITFGRLHDHRTKLRLCERCLEISQNFYGPYHELVAKSLTNLANAYGSLGDELKQKELLEKALELDEQLHGPEGFDVAVVLTNLGPIYTNLGQPEICREMLERALAIKVKILGVNHHEVATTAKHLGEVCCVLGDYGKGIPLLERTLAFEERHYSREHRNVGDTLGILGPAYRDAGKPHEACRCLERVLAIDIEEHGENDPVTLTTLTNLANAYGDSGDLHKHYNMLQHVLKGEREHYGNNSSEVAMTLYNLATVLFKMKKIQEAYDFCFQAREILKQHPNAVLRHPESARVEPLLALLRSHADFKVEKKRSSSPSFLDKKNPQSLEDYLRLANQCKREGNFAGQQSCLIQALNKVNDMLEIQQGANKAALYNLRAKIFIEMQDFDSAIESAVLALSISPDDGESASLIDTINTMQHGCLQFEKFN